MPNNSRVTALSIPFRFSDDPPRARRVPGSARPGPDPAAFARRRARLVALARLMDTAFVIPGLRLRIGLDPLLGLLPGAGDAVAALISLYIVVEGHRLGATPGQVARMLLNVGLDFAAGSVPLIGDLFDWAYKANTRNLAILGISAARA